MAKSYTLSTEGANWSARWCNGTCRGCNCTQCTRLATGLLQIYRKKPLSIKNIARMKPFRHHAILYTFSWFWCNDQRPGTYARGGGRRDAPMGFRAPAGRRPARAKTPAKTSETHTKVTKSLRKPTKKARPVNRGPSDHLGLPRKRAHQKKTGSLWASF